MRRIITTFGAVLLLALLALPGSALARSSHSKAARADRNHDGIADKWERRHHPSLRVNQAKRDQDSDGLNNLGEFRSKTNPRDADTDNDGTNDANEDADHDGVDNDNEVEEHTNPGVGDTNHNGRPDGREDADHDGLDNRGEDATGNDPTDSDTDDDTVTDGHENAGTVASFDGTTLVITLGNGQQVSGTVDPATTRISCENEDEHGDEQEENHRHHGGDARASREGESGDDHSGSGGDEDDANQPEAGDDDAGQPGHDGENEATCTTADLTAGTPVHEAKTELTSTGLVFDEVELVK